MRWDVEKMLTNEFNLVLPIPVGAIKRLSEKIFNFLTFFSLDWKMITVDMFSKNIKPNVCKIFSQMDVLLNNKTLKNIYNLHEHKVNIY